MTAIIDDIMFRKMAEEPSFCEEILRVIMNDSELIVLESNAQWVGQNLQGRSVILDAKYQLSNGKVVNIEVQKGRMKRLHLIRLYAIKIILFLHRHAIIKLVINIPARIHNTDYCYNSCILIRNIKYQIIVNRHYP